MIKNAYLNGKEKGEVQKIIQDKTGYRFKSTGILSQIFRRSSFAAENGLNSNEIFEFIGDQVLSFYVVKIVSERCGSLSLTGDYSFKIKENQFSLIKQILVNNEIKSMIAAFGCGISDDFDITKLRFDKIIILTDADVDGAHISTLLLTFFYRFMPELILEGKVYRGLPPLYKVTYEDTEGAGEEDSDSASASDADTGKAVKGAKKAKTKGKGKKSKNEKYLFNDFELEKFRKEGKKILDLQRYKGLGEMDADQLWETTLNPETRILAQVSISDTVEADEVTTLLMSNNVPPRRAFIMEEARYAKLDV